MTVPVCANCKFWLKQEGEQAPGHAIGSCLCEPPQLLLIPQQNPVIDQKKILTGGPVQQQMQLMPMAFFPIIQEDRWCGKHVPKPI